MSDKLTPMDRAFLYVLRNILMFFLVSFILLGMSLVSMGVLTILLFGHVGLSVVFFTISTFCAYQAWTVIGINRTVKKLLNAKGDTKERGDQLDP